MPEETRGVRCGYIVTTVDANGKTVEIDTPVAAHGWEAVTVSSEGNVAPNYEKTFDSAQKTMIFASFWRKV